VSAEAGRSELARRRDRLARQLAELQFDLGGLVYEMAIRDHFRLDLLVRQAARLQELDAELGEVERQLALEDAGAAGRCPSCGSLYARGALYCSGCGRQLMESFTPMTAASPARPAADVAPPTTVAPVASPISPPDGPRRTG
jgi:hypothetical protein